MEEIFLPDLLLVFGPRALLSLFGIVSLVLGVWHVDRTWDEKGSKAYNRVAKESGSNEDIKIPTKDLDDAFPFPWAFLMGWTMFALAYLFPVDGSFSIETSPYTVAGVVVSLLLGIVASVPMGEAVRNRNATKKAILGMTFLLLWIALTVATVLANGKVAMVCCPVGMVSIITSMKILWKNRKMGDSWEAEGKPNPNPVVYNLGGPLFVLGWFFFWIGMASTDQVENSSGLPLYLTLRSALAFLSGCGMVPIVMMLDYAHDEGAEYVGFGTDGRFFGRFAESPIPFILAWTCLGIASLLPFTSPTTRQWIILATCVLQGVDAGVLIQSALYEGDMERKNKWSIPFVLLFISLAINIGLYGGLPLALAFPGALLIIAGQKIIFGDRKRGDYFMQNNMKPNPNPIVYSYGEPVFMTGWIMMAWAISLPM